MEVRLGTGPDSWGVWFPQDEKQIPWQRYLKEAAEVGYEWTELGPIGYLPTDVETVRKELDDHGLKVTGAFTMDSLSRSEAWPNLEKQLNDAGELLQPLGGTYLGAIDESYTDSASSGLPPASGLSDGQALSPQLNEDEWKRLIDTTHKVAELVEKRFGLTFVLHPHVETHIEYEDQIERFLDDTDPEHVFLCLDTGHHAYRGGDPVAFMRKHHERIVYLHVKSMDAEVLKKATAAGIPHAKAVGMDVYCEPSLGVVDFVALRDVLKEVDYQGWAIVEHDMYPAPFDKPLPIAQRSRDYLREIDFGS